MNPNIQPQTQTQPMPIDPTQPRPRRTDTAVVVGIVHTGLKYGNEIANEYLPPEGQLVLGVTQILFGRRLRQDKNQPGVRSVGVTVEAHGWGESLVGILGLFAHKHRR